MNKKIIVAHPGKQHSLHTARAFENNKILYRYFTSIYDKDSFLNRQLKKSTVYRNKIKTRKMINVEDSIVQQYCQFTALVGLLSGRIKFIKKYWGNWNDHLNNKFGKKVAKYVIKDKNIGTVISYDNNSRVLFKILNKKSPKTIRILDVSAANLLFMKHIYEEDMKLAPEFADKLYEERKMLWNDKRMNKAKDEIQLSQYFLVGSNFVKKSLMFSGVKEDKIYVCPYGVDVDKFSFIPRKIKEKKESLKIIFVGGTKQLKGISYLLDAFLEIPKDIAQLTIIGVNNLSENLYAKYKDKINFSGQLSHDAVAQELSKADIMVFPSLGDGFGLVIIEAMAVGLPVIGSINSGASDIIEDGTNGFVIPIQDKNAIINKILWFNENRDKIPEMSQNSRNTALSLTWEKYYENVFSAVKDIIKREDTND